MIYRCPPDNAKLLVGLFPRTLGANSALNSGIQTHPCPAWITRYSASTKCSTVEISTPMLLLQSNSLNLTCARPKRSVTTSRRVPTSHLSTLRGNPTLQTTSATCRVLEHFLHSIDLGILLDYHHIGYIGFDQPDIIDTSPCQTT